MRRQLAVAMSAALGLAACGRADEAPAARGNDDPALASALGEEITVDPDLAAQNRANAAASLPSLDGSVPSLDTGPDAIARARDDALALVGGAGRLRQAPPARKIDAALPPEAALSAAARAAAAPGTGDCAGKVDYTAAWAARLPAAFPVYPRGAVQEAAGTDRDGCALRVVNFQTPVPLSEVMDFYYTRAGAAGFSAQHVLQDGDNVLGGIKGRASYTVYARKLPSGATEVDLVTSG
jgi:hypothetical protein